MPSPRPGSPAGGAGSSSPSTSSWLIDAARTSFSPGPWWADGSGGTSWKPDPRAGGAVVGVVVAGPEDGAGAEDGVVAAPCERPLPPGGRRAVGSSGTSWNVDPWVPWVVGLTVVVVAGADVTAGAAVVGVDRAAGLVVVGPEGPGSPGGRTWIVPTM